MTTPRLRHSLTLAAFALVPITLPAAVLAQTAVPDTSADQYDALITSGQTFDNFGNSIDIIGDLDGDGIDDLIVGDPRSDLGGANAGRVMVFSGRTGATLLNIVGSDIESDFGDSVANAGDTNGDGVDDIIISAPFWDQPGAPNGIGDDTGRAFIYSGADGSLLQTFTGVISGARFGFTLDSLGDIDGDGLGDITVGDIGTAFVFSGATGAPLAVHNLGAFVVTAGVGDVNGDGAPDYAAGISRSDAIGFNLGEVDVFSGADHSLIWQLADVNTARLANALTGADVNGDGFNDVIAANSNFSSAIGPMAGRVIAFDGATGAILYSLDGFNAHDKFGFRVVNAGDLDGDHCDDLLIYAPGFGTLTPGVDTRTYLYSGKTATLLRTWTGTTINTNVSVTIAVLRVADFNGDGAMDFAAPMFTTDHQTFVSAHVAYFLGDPHCAADLSGDRSINAADLASLLAAWGLAPASPADINGDGFVDAADLAQLLAQWGSCILFDITLP